MVKQNTIFERGKNMKRKSMMLLSGLLIAVLAISTPNMSVLAVANNDAAVTTEEGTISEKDPSVEVEEGVELESTENSEREILEGAEVGETISEEEETLEETEIGEIFGEKEEMTEETEEAEYVSFWDNEIWNEDLTEEEFMEHLAAMEIDPEVDPEGYQAWKEMMTGDGMMLMSLNDAPSNNIIGNEYIEIWAGNGLFTIGTTGGNPELSSDDNKIMIFGHPNSSTTYTTIRVDGQSYKYSASNGSFDVANRCYLSSNTYNGVKITQEIKIVNNLSTERDDVVQIKYTAENISGAAVNVGARIMLDTMLGNNDAAPFKVPGTGSLVTEKEYSGSSIPKYWQAFDSLTNPGVVSQGRLVIEGYEKPDKVQFTNWGNVYSTNWDYTVMPGRNNGDSAVSAIWNEKTLENGDTREFVTYYGLSEFEGDLLPPLALAVATDAVMNYDGKNAPEQDVMCYVQNISGATATNVKLSIELPSDLKLVSGEKTISFGTVSNNVERQHDWKITLNTKNPKSSYAIQVRVEADDCVDKVVTKNIRVDAESKKAIVVIPGIAATRLFTNGTVNSKDVIPDAFKNNADYQYTFQDGHQLWEPYTSTQHWSPINLFYQNQIKAEAMSMNCYADGTSIASIVPEATDRNDGIYGAQGTYTDLMNELIATYGDTYDVKFWGYDWRTDVSAAASALDVFLEQNGYSDVILVCHSMGGLVASKYIANGNGANINKLITIGTPYLGAPKALYVLESGKLLGTTASLVMAEPIKAVANNFTSVYELLPTTEYFERNNTNYVLYMNNNGPWKFATTNCYNYSQTKNLIAGRSWYAGKNFLTTAENFAASLFVNGEHVTKSVDSYYIVGYNEKTLMQVREEYNPDGSFESSKDNKYLKGGDGTVPFISATMGNSLPSDKDYYVEDEHAELVKNDKVIQLVENIIDGKPKDVPQGVSDTIPTNMTKDKYIKLQVKCPVNLELYDVDEDVEAWAHVEPSYIYNEKTDVAEFYLSGKENDRKEALLDDDVYNVKLLGTDYGSMTYVLSVLEMDDKECSENLRVTYKDVAITPTTIISTTTDYTGEFVLNVDENGDGVVDFPIYPTSVMNEAELSIDDIVSDFEEISVIASNKEIGMQINGADVKIEKAVLSDGTINCYTSKDVEISNRYNHINALYQNGIKKQTTHEISYDDIREGVEAYFAGQRDELPKGANSHGTTESFYNITTPISNIVTDHSIVISTQKFSTVHDCVVYSREGDVFVYLSEMDYDGIIYAPNGTVIINGSDIKIHGTIIADKIVINGARVVFD